MDLNELLDAAKKQTGSDGKTAARLGVSKQLLSGWRRGKSYPDLDGIAGLAEISGINQADAMTAVGYQKERDEGRIGIFTKRVQKIAASVALAVLFSVNLLLSPTPSEAAQHGPVKTQALYIMLNRTRLLRAINRVLAALRNCQMPSLRVGFAG